MAVHEGGTPVELEELRGEVERLQAEVALLRTAVLGGAATAVGALGFEIIRPQ